MNKIRHTARLSRAIVIHISSENPLLFENPELKIIKHHYFKNNVRHFRTKTAIFNPNLTSFSKFCDLIQDRYDLSIEFEWNIKKPTVEGLYRAVVKFIQTAEDDYKLVVLGYDKLITLPEPKILN